MRGGVFSSSICEVEPPTKTEALIVTTFGIGKGAIVVQKEEEMSKMKKRKRKQDKKFMSVMM